MKVLKGQLWHFVLLIVLLAGALFLKQRDASFDSGSLFGIKTNAWFYLAILTPVLHQIYVLVIWRLELYYQSLSRCFRKNGFLFYKIGFAFLIISRPITITFLAISNSNSFALDQGLGYLVSVVLAAPAVYLFYSVKKYFDFDRAFGIDHFNPKKMERLPMVKQGIFKYSSNAMYVYGFFALWIPGVLLQSRSALLAALFSHLYIWVHYYFTEKPDMHFIYRSKD